MPQVKIHVSNNIEGLIKGRIAIEVSDTMSRYADISDGILQVMVYESQYRINNNCKNDEFVLIEVLTSIERTREEKQWLANLLINKVEEVTNIDSKDITVVYNDTEKVKYFGIAKKASEKHSYEEDMSSKIINYQRDIVQAVKNESNNKIENIDKEVQKKSKGENNKLNETSKNSEDKSTFELLYNSELGLVNITRSKILKL